MREKDASTCNSWSNTCVVFPRSTFLSEIGVFFCGDWWALCKTDLANTNQWNSSQQHQPQLGGDGWRFWLVMGQGIRTKIVSAMGGEVGMNLRCTRPTIHLEILLVLKILHISISFFKKKLHHLDFSLFTHPYLIFFVYYVTENIVMYDLIRIVSIYTFKIWQFFMTFTKT